MSKEIEAIATDIVDCAFKVHKQFGPGLLESAYQACHAHELRKRGHHVVQQAPIQIYYDGVLVGEYFADLLVDGKVIVELKAIERFEKIHEAQLHTYLRLIGLNIGLLINFNVSKLVDGLKRIVHDFPND